ncbi:MAG: TIGR04282 family arsenosugar biosynthesis glycosyltransferase [Myxococcales bacterium]|nr:TIGR04282 family arsenosugar biosynthesis glycosyltransferase [Myxococcales bacterium]
MIRGAVVVMAKAPREGSVKTRLTVAYSPADVVRLSECMLLDTLALVRSLPRVHAAVVCPSEDVAEIESRLPAGIDVVGQRGNGLAAGLVSGFEQFVPRFHRVVAVDSDSPHLPLAILESAFELLETNDVVVGPTEDGGYYLVGASATHPHLFDAAPLGTRDAREALLSNARGLSVAFTEPWYDVDVPADLRRLAAELRIEPSRAPRTAALLESWDARDEELAG